LSGEGRSKKLGQHGDWTVVCGEIREPAGMLPMGDSRQDNILEISENLLKGLAPEGWRLGQLFLYLTRPDSGYDRVFLNAFHVVSRPVDELIAMLAKELFVHGISPFLYYIGEAPSDAIAKRKGEKEDGSIFFIFFNH
jgi:hypothetical protein